MGYTTDFYGKFELNKPLDQKTKTFLKRFNETRRMAFDPNVIGQEYGIDGEFFVGHHEDFSGEFAGQVSRDYKGLVEYNTPPSTQPGLWCQWVPTDDGKYIEWDGGEKFYNYVEWLQYIVKNFLQPKGYSISGEVKFQGESPDDRGLIIAKDNKIECVNDLDELARLRKENADLKNKLADSMLLEE